MEPGIEPITIICNKKKLSYIQILTKLKLPNQEIVLPAILDTGPITNTIDISLIPKKYILTSKHPRKSAQIDGTELELNKYIKNIEVQLQAYC